MIRGFNERLTPLTYFEPQYGLAPHFVYEPKLSLYFVVYLYIIICN